MPSFSPTILMCGLEPCQNFHKYSLGAAVINYTFADSRQFQPGETELQKSQFHPELFP